MGFAHYKFLTIIIIIIIIIIISIIITIIIIIIIIITLFQLGKKTIVVEMKKEKDLHCRHFVICLNSLVWIRK